METIALFSWRATLLPANSRDFLVRTLAKRSRTAPLIVLLFVRGRLLGKYDPNLFIGNRRKGCRSIIRNIRTRSVSYSLVLSPGCNPNLGMLGKNCQQA